MSTPASKISLPSKPKFVRVPALCSLVDSCDFWGEDDSFFPCSVAGCRKKVNVDCAFYEKGYEPNWKRFGCDEYDSNIFFPVLCCNCKAPVCDNCTTDPSGVECRICGKIEDIDILLKRTNRPRKVDIIDFVCMTHTVANDFIKTNLGSNWTLFLKWFIANGRVIDITKINTDEMCEIVSKFKLFCLKWVFLKSTFAVMKQIPLAPVASIFNPHFEKFMKKSSKFVGSLPFIIFRNEDLEMYRIFGFMMKMIAKITRNSVVFICGRESQFFSLCFRSFYARLLLTKL